MPALGIHHVNIHAPRSELAGVRDFYVAVLGLVDGFRPPFSSFGYWLYAGDDPVVHLSADEEASAAVDCGAIDHVAFRCTDFEAMCDGLDSLGIAYTLSEVPGKGIRQVFFSDPLGNGIELSFSPGYRAAE